MIVVVGNLAWRAAPPTAPAGRACGVAVAAARRGARVELVGRAGDDRAGDALLLALATAGVGHAAVLRDPARATMVAEPATAPGDGDDDDAASPLSEAAPAAVPAAGTGLAPTLEGADVALAIRYLDPSGVLVVTDDVPLDVLAAAVEAGRFAGTRLVVLLPAVGCAPGAMPAGLPDDATVLAAPDPDDEGADAFDALVGAYAAAIDGGASPADAFAAATGDTGWEALAPG